MPFSDISFLHAYYVRQFEHDLNHISNGNHQITDILKKDLIDYINHEEKQENEHLEASAALNHIRNMLYSETRGLTRVLYNAYLERRVRESLEELATLMVPGIDVDFLTELSSERYEGAEAKKHAILLIPDAEMLKTMEGSILFDENNQFLFMKENAHAIRKQMNLASRDNKNNNDDNSHILAAAFIARNGKESYKTVGIVPAKAERMFYSIYFPRLMCWELMFPTKVALSCFLRYCNGRMKLPLLNYQKYYVQIVKKVFGLDDKDSLEIAHLIEHASQSAKKGTVLIIAEEKSILREKERLVVEGNRGICSEASTIRINDYLESFENIDGAIMMDLSGICHSFGAILDGTTRIKGDPSRGARFNSILTYISNCSFPVLGVVISEDGMVDLIHKSGHKGILKEDQDERGGFIYEPEE